MTGLKGYTALFILATATGVGLAFYYTPSTATGHSTRNVEISAGMLIRSLHLWLAAAAVICITWVTGRAIVLGTSRGVSVAFGLFLALTWLSEATGLLLPFWEKVPDAHDAYMTLMLVYSVHTVALPVTTIGLLAYSFNRSSKGRRATEAKPPRADGRGTIDG